MMSTFQLPLQSTTQPNDTGNEYQALLPEIFPQQPDTVLLAILSTINEMPAGITVQQCLDRYLELKLKEIEDAYQLINREFLRTLEQMEDDLIEHGRVPANSVDDPLNSVQVKESFR